MHKNIKKFSWDGSIKDDADFPRLRNHFEQMILMDMRNKGYVPVLDIGTYFSTLYKDEKYEFILTIYGVFVGKSKSWEIEGYSGGTTIPRNIVSNK